MELEKCEICGVSVEDVVYACDGSGGKSAGTVRRILQVQWTVLLSIVVAISMRRVKRFV